MRLLPSWTKVQISVFDIWVQRNFLRKKNEREEETWEQENHGLDVILVLGCHFRQFFRSFLLCKTFVKQAGAFFILAAMRRHAWWGLDTWSYYHRWERYRILYSCTCKNVWMCRSDGDCDLRLISKVDAKSPHKLRLSSASVVLFAVYMNYDITNISKCQQHTNSYIPGWYRSVHLEQFYNSKTIWAFSKAKIKDI